MKTLFTTTAIILALGIPAIAVAQTADTTTAAPAAGTDAEMNLTAGFMASRAMNDMLATDLIGHDVYARRVATDMQTNGTAMGSMAATDLDQMDNIGQINDLVLSADGSIQALVIGVGGFIGMGEQDVAVTMDQVSFATDSTNPSDMYVVLNTPGDLLKTSPAFDRMAAMDAATDPAVADDTAAPTTMAERERLTAPELERDGFSRAAVGDMSIDTLIGKTVYGADDKNVGTVDDVIVGENGAVQDVIIDFGGFLGMGTTQVALSFDELTILTTEGYADVRVYVDATKEQIQAMPTYTAMK